MSLQTRRQLIDAEKELLRQSVPGIVAAENAKLKRRETMAAPVLYYASEGVATITLNRPEVLNALNTERLVQPACCDAAWPTLMAVRE
ncbi:hypothetical protein CNE_BB1p09300 (plasmid) [Cupriavidus necator N-1]|uniref:Enoyl-CoA hydratase n=1 Tax=Cupriavidus necator (strain ATCC 43291 / DSM 13513 / CCUG 52238 / LMG 8453 / N-1) TaxID=1042878 RepID=F8GUD8_CUPNN|nr:hypothetical protein [Cupriavidus necator]AEI82342.1 hypothetical protein CNE_BB1p09300 [Cupriavidus necator N-1]MDX6007355.1 hypothetical protein [Cupriavidus necator]